MKNGLIYFYNINITDIKKVNDKFYFLYNNSNYVIEEYKRNVDEAVAIYNLNKEMLSNGVPVFEIIPTRLNSILFTYESKNYILMKMPLINNRFITYEDVLRFNYITKDNNILKALNKSNWAKLWENKIDYYEYQFNEIRHKYPIILESINYYIGISENAISYFNDNVDMEKLPKVVSHLRISPRMDLYDFYNPLNLVIDCKERDIGEYIKEFILYENYTDEILLSYITMKKDNKLSIMALICRILFASYYFDLYEKIIDNKVEEKVLYQVISKRKNINFIIKLIFEKYSYLNIPFINWIMVCD